MGIQEATSQYSKKFTNLIVVADSKKTVKKMEKKTKLKVEERVEKRVVKKRIKKGGVKGDYKKLLLEKKLIDNLLRI